MMTIRPITIRNVFRKATIPLLAGLIGISVLGGAEIVRRAYAQPGISPNFAFLRGAALGASPALVCQGLDLVVNCNIVPKGGGQLLVNGVAIPGISGGAGTFASVTVNPGPLAVTGTTNLTGPLFVQPGTAVTLKRVGARIAHNNADVATTGLVIETLYTFSVEANTLAVNGQSLRFTVYATAAANANSKTLDLTFGATTIGTFTAAANNDLLRIVCDLFRTGAATQKAICFGDDGDLAAVAGNAGRGVVTTPAENLALAVAVLVRGTTPTAIADLTARAAMIDWNPVGQ